MSPIKPVQPIGEQQPRHGIQNSETEADQKLSRREIAIVASSGIGTVGLLTLIAWLLLPISGHIVPFVAVSAWPALTLLAIIYQAVVYRRQWNAMLHSQRQTDKIINKMQSQLTAIREQTSVMQNSLTETQKMVSHSERSVQIAEQNMEYAQRAYVGFTTKRFVTTGFAVQIENCGNTPAQEVMVEWIADAGIFPPELPKLGDAEPRKSELVFLGLLAPRSPGVGIHPIYTRLDAPRRS